VIIGIGIGVLVVILALRHVCKKSLVSPALLGFVKVASSSVFSFLQLVLLIEKSYSIALPDNFRAFLAHFRFLSFDRFHTFGLSCYGANYHTSLVCARTDPACACCCARFRSI
jgi:hypothetical protein